MVQSELSIMKYGLLILSLFASTYAISEEYQNEAMAMVVKIADECVKQTGADEDDLAELMDKKTPSKKEGKCLVACFYNELGVMKNGKIDKEGTMEMLAPLKEDDAEAYSKMVLVMNKVHEDMQDVNEQDKCEYAMVLAECTEKVAKELNVNLEEFLL